MVDHAAPGRLGLGWLLRGERLAGRLRRRALLLVLLLLKLRLTLLILLRPAAIAFIGPVFAPIVLAAVILRAPEASARNDHDGRAIARAIIARVPVIRLRLGIAAWGIAGLQVCWSPGVTGRIGFARGQQGYERPA